MHVDKSVAKKIKNKKYECKAKLTYKFCIFSIWNWKEYWLYFVTFLQTYTTIDKNLI